MPPIDTMPKGASGDTLRHAAAVTPNDVTDLPYVASAIQVGGGGTITVDTEGGETAVTFTLPAGETLDLRVTRVRLTGTTATLIVAMWP